MSAFVGTSASAISEHRIIKVNPIPPKVHILSSTSNFCILPAFCLFVVCLFLPLSTFLSLTNFSAF
jgi:hypothetical protein